MNELKTPNACVLILLMLMPVLALLTTTDNAVAVACTCPFGGQYFSSIRTSLCGWQYNVCVTWDYNCANDYPAVCWTTTTRTMTRSITTRSTTTIRTGTRTTTITCSYIEIMMGQCKQEYSLTYTQTTQSYTQPTVRTTCDPSYPTVCIPPPPPDLDCKDIPYRRFRVLSPDPHHFDGDHDGTGCEWD